uniref:Uncharacterized protein n=1 Tax=Sus scrofa TaxID=9823 RepID=A0A8D1GZ58_PIG
QGWFFFSSFTSCQCLFLFLTTCMPGLINYVDSSWSELRFRYHFTLFYFILFGLFSLEAEDAQLHSLRKNRTQEIQPVIQDKRLDVSLSSAIFTYFTYQCYSCSLKLHLRR